MPYGLFDYTPDNTIHTMGLSPTAVQGEPLPQPPPGWTDPYGAENVTLRIPENPPQASSGLGQGSPPPPLPGGVRPPDYGKATPVVTLAIPENPGDPIPKIMAENPPKGTPGTSPTSPVWTPPTTVYVRAPCDQIEERYGGADAPAG